MKIIAVSILVLILSISSSYAQDWDTYMNSYDKNQIINPVTPQEFENAINTVKSIQNKNVKKDKKKKKNKKDEMNIVQPPAPVKEFVIPSSQGMLLRLPTKVIVNDVIITDGFYLIDKVVKDKKVYLKIMQSGIKLAEVDTVATTDKYTGFSQLSVDNKGKVLEILYIDKENSLKAELPIFINNVPE